MPERHRVDAREASASPGRGLAVPRWTAAIALSWAMVAAGCGSGSSSANIELRKENQSLRDQLAAAQTERDGYVAQIHELQSRTSSTVPQLPLNRLDQLFTTHGLSFGRLTGGYHPSPDQPGDTMVKVYVVPTDEDGEPLKAAGSFTVELFDLADAKARLGHWDFSLGDARKDWFGRAFLYTYVLECPWQTKPTHPNVLVRVTFNDALTGRQFTQDKEITIAPPP